MVAAARREPVTRAPVWIMRQAGRYLPEYRAIREKHGFMEMCKTPELAAEVSHQPIERLGVDAAIIFSDILIPLEAMGLPVEFTEKGPKLAQPIRSVADVVGLRIPEPAEDMPFVAEAIRILGQRLAGKVPIIGFSGAPFTLASYAVDGGGSKDYAQSKKLMVTEPKAFGLLLDKLAETIARSLEAQVKAGASLVQIFDSWGGVLSESAYREFALPATRKAVEMTRTRTGVPIIYYLGGGPHLLTPSVRTGADVLSVDWRLDLGKVLDRHGKKVAVQGNLDPTLLYADPARIRAEVAKIRASVAGRPGHIWNLGHGILPDIPVEHARAFVEAARGD
ncbi:MAG: uroporphyrinogen decarboxylase [Candidatus Sericytochromatia bacterium]|nr:uroporphyrinogen decarboxylase [Candidatus Tanganyikabacteria bacterium]